MTAPPAWQDIATLTRNICCCERTVDAWVKLGLLPAPRVIRGKRLWKWTEVEKYLEGRAPEAQASEHQAEGITNATRAAAAEGRKDRERNVRPRHPIVHDERQVSKVG